MGYRPAKPRRSTFTSVEVVDGESLEQKIARIQELGEPIKDGAPEIYTDRKDGVISAYNIRTDRWEIAADAMDSIAKGRIARREGKAEVKVVELNPKEGDSSTKESGA